MKEFNEPIKEDLVVKLSDELRIAGIDTSSWGTGKAKTLLDLQREIEDKEATLIKTPEGKLLRVLVIGAIDVLYYAVDGKKFRLREDKQVFKDGRERRRDLGHAISGKMQTGEDPLTATMREIRQELKIEGLISLEKLGIANEELITSPSYPGLPSQYIIHKYEVFLGDEQFRSEGYIEKEEKTGITTYFVWEEI